MTSVRRSGDSPASSTIGDGLEEAEGGQPALGLEDVVHSQRLALAHRELAPHDVLARLVEPRDHDAVDDGARPGGHDEADARLGGVFGEVAPRGSTSALR